MGIIGNKRADSTSKYVVQNLSGLHITNLLYIEHYPIICKGKTLHGWRSELQPIMINYRKSDHVSKFIY